MVLTDDELRDQFNAGTPMRRPGTPEDIACAALYLASAASSWVTGKVFQVDGGVEAPAITVPVATVRANGGRGDLSLGLDVHRCSSSGGCGPGESVIAEGRLAMRLTSTAMIVTR